MHIGGGLDRIRAGVKTLHLAEILASTDTDTDTDTNTDADPRT
jgi:L-lactate dehydrogenase complex protein LldE